MKFALVIIETEDSRRHIQEDRRDHRQRLEAWMAKQAQSKKLIGGEAFETEKIRPVTIRRNITGVITVTDGPFAGKSETLGGYILVDVASRDEAVELAKSWPTDETIEVRPIWVAEQ